MTEKKAKKNHEPEQEHVDIQSLKDEIEALRAEKERLNDSYLRLAAEYENYKKRQTKNFGEMVSAARDVLILKMLDVLDNLERAIGRTETPLSTESLIEGIQLIHKQFNDMLKAENIAPVCEVGDLFDPSLHEAVALVKSEGDADCVATILQQGYRCGERLIRPARVIVGPANNRNESAEN